MNKKYPITLDIAVICFWTVVSLFIIISPFSELIYYPVAFNKINIPIFYWLWVFLGMFFLMFTQKKPGDTAKTFILTAIFFHMTILMAELSADSAIHTELATPYRLYVYAFIYGSTFLLFLWSTHPLIGPHADVNLFLPRIPLSLAPFFCLFYSIYKMNTESIFIFGLSATSGIGALFLRRYLKRVAASLGAILRRIKENRRVIFCIFLLAFLARMAFSVNIIAKTGNDYMSASDDGILYDKFATKIVNEPEKMIDVLVKESFWPPAYTLFLSAIYKLCGRNFYIVGLIQSLLGACTALFIYLLAKRIFDENTAIISGFLIALNQPLIFLSATLHTEAIYLPLLSLGMLLFLDGFLYGRKGVYLKMILSGVVFALGTLTFPVLALFPFIAVLFPILDKTRILRKRLQIAAVFLISFITLLFSVKCALALKSGTWVTKYELNGHLHWQMTRSSSEASYKIYPDNREFIAMDIDPYKPIESLRIAAANPKEIMGIIARTFPARIRNFFFWAKFGSFDPIFLTARIPSNYITNLEFYAVIFFFIGFFMCFFKKENIKKAGVILVLLFIAYQTFILSMIFSPHRMRHSSAVKVFLIIFCAYGLSIGIEYFRKAIQSRR